MSEALLPELSALAATAPNPEWAAAALERLAEGDLRGVGPSGLARLARAAGSSAVVGNWLHREPGLLDVFSAADLDTALGVKEYGARLVAPARSPEPPDVFHRRLRRVRRREILRIVTRESLGLAPVEVTAGELSALAEAALDAAVGWAEERLRQLGEAPPEKDGRPGGVCALGLGKLGGGELNLSSDIDLIFLYPSSRGKDEGGGTRHDPRSCYVEIVRLVAEALGKVTEDGIVFRVDLGLRPEGRNGALAQPLNNAVLYYQSWGQTWERAALMKARPVAGDRELGERFLAEVEPFVFRRSLDYTTVEDIAVMKQRIDETARMRGGADDDLKIGPGGIREVEFFVQTLQLVHGGRTPEIRERNTLAALDRLAAAELVDPTVARELGNSYRFLRRAEHAVQSLHFRQTHRLPTAPEELRTVARRLGFGGEEPVALLRGALEKARSPVRAAYVGLARGAEREWEADPEAMEARALLAVDPHEPGAADQVKRAGFRDPVRALEALRLLRRGPARGYPSRRTRRRLERLAPFLLNAARRAPDPDRALLGLAEFLAGSGARAGYLSLLEENPPTARLLVTLFGTSGFLSRYLLGHPELLDELVLHGYGSREKTPGELELGFAEGAQRRQDEEDRLDVLRHFRNAEFLRIALNDLAGGLDPEEVSQQVTAVAEVCLEHAYRDALGRLTEKYGTPEGEGGTQARFAVLGLGKLGGAELDYYSDLDVLFLYSGPGSTRPLAGGKALDNAEFFARLAQRLISALSVRTREGIAFKMDARLRPSGQAGPLVTSLAAFAAYHRGGGGQVWERQALVRLRPVAGDPGLGAAAVATVRDLLYGAPPSQDPRPEVDRMRDRIEREVGRESEGHVDLKAGAGGTIDVEFAVQCLQLLHGWRDESLRSPSTMESLVALRKCGILAEDDGEVLQRGHQFLRRVEARLRILQERPTDRLPVEPERLAELARGLGYEGAGSGRLTEAVRMHKEGVRRAYEHVLRGGEG